MKQKNIYIIGIVVLVSFSAGYGIAAWRSQGVAKEFPIEQRGRAGLRMGNINHDGKGMNNIGLSGKLISGTVSSVENGLYTLSTKDGGSRILMLAPNAVVTKNTIANPADITEGVTATFTGEAGIDGTFSAVSVQIR